MWRAEREARLAEACRLALQPSHGIGMVVIAGDLFEHYDPPQALVSTVLEELGRLVEAGIAVVTVPGNHDELTYPQSVYQTLGTRWPGILITHPNPDGVGPIEVGGQRVYLYGAAYTGGVTRAWPPLDAFPARAARDGWHIGVFHGTLILPEGPGELTALPDRSLPLRLDALAQAGYDYVALGHIHQHRQYRVGRTTAAYCGAVDAKGFDDPGVGFFTVVTLGDGGAIVERVPAARRPVRVLEVDVGPFASLDELAVWLAGRVAPSGEPPALARVRLHGVASFALAADALHARLAPVCFYLDVVDETETVSEEYLSRLAAEPTVRGLFVRRMRQQILQASDEGARRRLQRALKLGLHALEAAS